MKNSRFTETQILKFLKEAEVGVPVADLCRKPTASSSASIVRLRKSSLKSRFARSSTSRWRPSKPTWMTGSRITTPSVPIKVIAIWDAARSRLLIYT